MQRIKTTLIGIVLLTVVATGASFFIQVPASWPLSAIEFYLPFAANVIMASLYVGASVLLVTNMDVYKTRLRRAYTGMATSSVIIGLGMLQISIIGALDAWRSTYVLAGGMMLPFLLAAVLMYASIRLLALLTGTRHPLERAWLAGLIAGGVAFLSFFAPHVELPLQESAFDAGIAIIMFSTTLLFICFALILRVRQQAGSIYTRPLGWLATALLVSGITLTIQCIYYLITTDYDHIITRVNNVVGCISGVLWIRAAYALALTKYRSDDLSLFAFLLSNSATQREAQIMSAGDLVLYATGLASNSSDIRSLSSALVPSSPHDQQQKQSEAHLSVLFDTYLEIERYLITDEAVRRFSRDEIRSRIDPKLRAQLEHYEK